MSYLYGDHLGSTSITTDASGANVKRQWYSAFGEIRPASDGLATDFAFTGQRRDSHTKLIQMGAQEYDPELGRFIQANTIVPQAGNPQSLNRYAYAYWMFPLR